MRLKKGGSMMTKDALMAYRTYKDNYQVEKDYLQDLLLYHVYANSSNEMVLKGGTAFSKFYSSDRFSWKRCSRCIRTASTAAASSPMLGRTFCFCA